MSSTNGADQFSGYEQDFYALKSDFEKAVEVVSLAPTADKKKTAIQIAEHKLVQANETIDQMERELLDVPTSSRVKLQARLRLLKMEGEKMKRDLRRASFSPLVNQDRDELVLNMDTERDFDTSAIDQRQRLLYGTDRLGESSRRLDASHRLALETENVGINILSTLKGQRETLLRTRDTLGEADSYIDKSSRTLKIMARRMTTNKVIIGVIILVLVALIVLTIWSKLF
ncbi:snare region anchored in the vesicle membrane C-terminus-domain-containing protein [Absidia repens]|uniref:Snare region anchored in the vesicle membrane C-terminus-domain-containing protein n=1 Tax=Absidia repens TaxID=90262 RepID=A0A1X2IJP3_9FUNG|nr:snare region anchored in the vesicle membrane C-terminus-domain-containing protein [Absidia repens]